LLPAVNLNFDVVKEAIVCWAWAKGTALAYHLQEKVAFEMQKKKKKKNYLLVPCCTLR
jgi:c-di-GMP-binding flagellar brake protein YcgR